MNVEINIRTTVVGSVYHLFFILFKNRPDLLDSALEKKEFLNSFIYISVSMYLYSSKFIDTNESMHSEWIFFLFRYILTKYPSYFGDLYSFEYSEDNSMECDSSLMYLTILEPFVRISMIRNNLESISDLMMSQVIREIQNSVSKTIISSLEYKDVLLNILIELETNTNLREDKNNRGSILLNVLHEDINKEIFLCEMKKYYCCLNKYLKEKLELVKSNGSLLIISGSDMDESILILENAKTWISVFQLELDDYEFDIVFFEEILGILLSILKIMLDFRRECVEIEGIRTKIDESIWSKISQVISISSILQAILSISSNNEHMLCKFKEDIKGEFT
ncbi:hypothetical protein FG379_003426 [Cryptosporidium bovis]|uniref:uncharacterized protein n=1 Tax=Cryptosporidium bovis TaxID=310047 RepID=UPI00351A196E|nr:hypothetical protein FG379_003426 [Cryptosporidium bovis]